MTVGEKIKPIYNQIKQNKAQYNLERYTPKICALSSENVNEYNFITDKEKSFVRKSSYNQKIQIFTIR